MSDPTFTTVGDAALEARIVSWVLGEASAFEIAELERLCAERPELMVFRRRIAALHALMPEAENPPADTTWRLPATKRKPIEELMETAPATGAAPAIERRVHHSARRAALAIAACLLFTVVVAGLLAPMTISQRKKEMEQSIVAYEAAAPEVAGKSVASNMMALQPDFPAERIEGTPRPMVLPERTPNAEPKARLRSLETDALAQLDKSKVQVAPKPSAPGSSMSKALAAATNAATAIPVPEIAMNEPSPNFGDGSDFGTGWGGGYKQENGTAITAGNRSGDGAITRESIDGLLAGRDALADNGGSDPFAASPESSDRFSYQETNQPGVFYGGADLADAKNNDFKADSGVDAFAAAPAPAQVPSTGGLSARQGGQGGGEGNASVLAEAERARKTGRYDEARELLENQIAAKPSDQEAQDALAYLDDPVRTNPALSDAQKKDADQVRRNLYMGSGNQELGEFDKAKENYEDVLEVDPSNSAARRGLEQIASAKTDYYRAAYDHTRAELLAEVDSTWEMAVPEKPRELDAFPVTPATPSAEHSPATQDELKALQDIPLVGKLFSSDDQGAAGNSSDLAQREMTRRQNAITEAEQLAQQASAELAMENNGRAYDLYQQALKSIPDVPSNAALQAKRDAIQKSKFQAALGLTDKDAITKAICDQENELEEQRKILAASVRTKGIIDKGQNADEAAPDPSEFKNAKREFEEGQKLLETLNKKLESVLRPEPPTAINEETSAAEDPFSTFSLNISDASFRIAQAALAKGETPDPYGIKVEQFYNAVDYGDPSPATGEPVACRVEQAAHPVIPGRNLVRIALKTAAAGRSAGQPLRLTLLVDQSGSMTRGDRREAMDKALAGLAGLLTPQDRVTVIGFSRTSRLIAEGLTGDKAANQLAEVVNPSASEGGTNLETALDLATELALRHREDIAQNRIVLFTDGAANLGDADPERLAAKVEQLRQQGLALDIAGIAADDINDRLLAELARKGNGRYHIVGKGDGGEFAKQLAGAFRPAAENVKVQVHFNPGRVKGYKLIGFEKERLKTEDFRNDAVDAAEMAAEEAGVAIYQVEPIPDGTGEIGEVSVRFRDTASGSMVERSWTIPHDPATPVLDRAAPSMQLATLALMVGEKLKGGPLADAIDFKTLAPAQATVKQAFGHDSRIAELLRMVDALK